LANVVGYEGSFIIDVNVEMTRPQRM